MSQVTSMIKKQVKTPSGVGMVEDFYITELGYFMMKVKFKDDNGMRFVNYNLGLVSEAIKNEKIEFI